MFSLPRFFCGCCLLARLTTPGSIVLVLGCCFSMCWTAATTIMTAIHSYDDGDANSCSALIRPFHGCNAIQDTAASSSRDVCAKQTTRLSTQIARNLVDGCYRWGLVNSFCVYGLRRSMHGEMLRRMAEGDRDRRKVEEVKEAEAKVRPRSSTDVVVDVVAVLLKKWTVV